MEKKCRINSYDNSSKEYQRWLRFKELFEKECGSYGDLSLDCTDERNSGSVLVLRMPWMSQVDFDKIMERDVPKPTSLSTLADDVANSICDDNTRKKFQEFANLLIEKVEKK